MRPALRFGFLTPFYDTLNQFAYPEAKVKAKIIDVIDLQNGDKVLDIGCGTGTLLLMASEKKSIHAVGIDPDPNILALAHEKLKTRKGKSSLQLSKASATKLPFPNDYFNIVMSSLTFHHLNSKEKENALKEIYRVLKPESKLLIADWGRPKNAVMRAAFFFVQLLDGFESTSDNLHGRIPQLISDAGFDDVETVDSFSTLVGSLHLYLGHKK